MLQRKGVADVTPLANALLSNTIVTALDLAHNKIESGEPICKALLWNTTLKSLHLSENQIKEHTPFLQVIYQNTTLTELYLGWNKIPFDGLLQERVLETVLNNFTLQKLFLHGNTGWNDNVMSDVNTALLRNQTRNKTLREILNETLEEPQTDEETQNDHSSQN